MEILRASNIAGPTSAPFNSFTLFRSNIFGDENTTYLVYHPIERTFGAGLNREADNVKIKECNGSISKLITHTAAWVKSNSSCKNKIIHAHQPGVGIVAFLIASLVSFFRVPLIYTVHNSINNFVGVKRSRCLSVFLFADEITFVSKDSFSSFKPYLPKHVLRKSVVIQNGIDIDRIRKATFSLKRRQVSKPIALHHVLLA